MKALVLEKKGVFTIRDIEIKETMGDNDVEIKIDVVGVCGSDVHFYKHGKLGPFVVDKPVVLGHEAAGTIIKVGSAVKKLNVGDRVCMEPGIPNWQSEESLQGNYNLDPDIKFWAAPPVHGCLRETVVHPAALTFKLPDNVSLEEGAMVEPLAVGMYAVKKAQVQPGDVAVVLGAGTIGLLLAASALAGGCSKVMLVDMIQPKLDMAAKLGSVVPVNIKEQNPNDVIAMLTNGRGADIVFEASGNRQAAESVFDLVRPAGKIVFVGCPSEPISLDIVKAQTKEATLLTIFRYANIYSRAIAQMESAKIDVKPFITDTYDFDKSVEAFDYACNPKPESVKIQINLNNI